MPKPDNPSPEVEAKHHTYVSNVIPWFVRLIWLGFWVLFLYYVFRWLIPALKVELFTPP